MEISPFIKHMVLNYGLLEMLLVVLLGIFTYICYYFIIQKGSNKVNIKGNNVSGNIVGGDLHISSSNGTTIINGVRYSGTNVRIDGGKLFIDGVEQKGQQLAGVVEVRILEGAPVNLTTDASVNCADVKGNVQAGGSVNCDAVGGNVSAGGSVNCDDVGGNVSAGGSVRRG